MGSVCFTLLRLLGVGLEWSWTSLESLQAAVSCPSFSYLFLLESIPSFFGLHPQNSAPAVFRGNWEVRILDTGAFCCYLHVFGRDTKAARAHTDILFSESTSALVGVGGVELRLKKVKVRGC